MDYIEGFLEIAEKYFKLEKENALLRKQLEESRKDARTDSLTGLKNRGALTRRY